MGPKEARSTVLTPIEEAAVVALRKQTLLPLDDVLFALQPLLSCSRSRVDCSRVGRRTGRF